MREAPRGQLRGLNDQNTQTTWLGRRRRQDPNPDQPFFFFFLAVLWHMELPDQIRAIVVT